MTLVRVNEPPQVQARIEKGITRARAWVKEQHGKAEHARDPKGHAYCLEMYAFVHEFVHLLIQAAGLPRKRLAIAIQFNHEKQPAVLFTCEKLLNLTSCCNWHMPLSKPLLMSSMRMRSRNSVYSASQP